MRGREGEPQKWELRADHTLVERALILAEMAFADFSNDRLDLIERAAFRIADALAKYERLAALPRPSEEMVEAAAKAIFDAENDLDGDRVGTMIQENFRCEVRDGDKALGDTMTVCRAAARAALETPLPPPVIS